MKCHKSKIDRIHTQIQKSTSRKFRFLHTFHMRKYVTQIRGQRGHLTDHTTVYNLINHLSARHISGPDRLCQKKSLVLSHPNQFLCLLSIYGKCFFHKNMFSVLKTHLRVLIMMRMWRCHIHQLHFRIFQHLLIRAVCLLKIPFISKFFCTFNFTACNCIFLYRINSAHRFCHAVSNISRCQNCEFHFPLSPFFAPLNSDKIIVS